MSKSYPKSAQALVALGRLYLKVNDDVGAEAFFKQAIQTSGEMPAPKIVFLDYLLKRERPEEALNFSESLIEEGWGEQDKGDEFTARRVWSMHFRCLIENQRFDSVINVPTGASRPIWFVELARCASAQAIICQAQPRHSDSPNRAIESLVKASKLLTKPPTHERIRGVWWIRSYRLLCRELAHFFDTNDKITLEPPLAAALLDCMVSGLAEVYENATLQAVRSEAAPVLRALKRYSSGGSDRFFNSQWIKNILGQDSGDPAALHRLVADGYVLVTVYKVPYSQDNIPQYVFAEDNERQRYFVGSFACQNFDHVAWAQIRVGSRLAVRKFRKPASSEHYPKPEEVVLLR